MLNLTLNKNKFDLKEYIDRLTARAIILGEDEQILIVPYGLIGGGVDEGETLEQALHRKALEEAGVEIEIIKELGQVIGYRDSLKQKYIINIYLAKYLNKISEPTDPEHQDKNMPFWENINDSIERIEKELQEINTKGIIFYGEDTYQGKILNRQTALSSLEEYLKTK